jgi:hypothetical protein
MLFLKDKNTAFNYVLLVYYQYEEIEMKKSQKIITASLLIAAGYASVVSAHNQSGSVGTAASGAAATDVYQVTCSNDGSGAPAQLFAQVADLAPVLATLVSVQIVHPLDGLSTVLSEDPVDGDTATVSTTGASTTGWSPGVTLKGGAAANAQIYLINVNKQYTASTVAAQKGPELYNLQLHCQTATGVHTGTNWIQTQNQ